MKLIYHTSLALALSSSIAMGQLIIPTGQDRHVTAFADVDGGTPENNTASAADFGPFVMSVTANASSPQGGAMSGASQDSEILADSIIASGVESASAGPAGDSGSESIASIDFDVPVKVSWRLTANYESYDQGFFSYDLTASSGQYIGSWFGIAEGPQSIDHSGEMEAGSYNLILRVQGGSDFAFADFDSVLQLTALSGNYCVGAANSSGAGASLALGGSQSIFTNDFRVEASGVAPNVFGLVFYGPNQIQAPFGDGFRCIGGQTFRVQPPVQADGSGNLSKSISFTSGPAASGNGTILPTSTWNFQLWYRDPMGPGGNGYNTSDGIWATFCP